MIGESGLDFAKVDALDMTTCPVPSFFGDCFLLLRLSARTTSRVPNSICDPVASSSLIFSTFLVIVFYCSESVWEEQPECPILTKIPFLPCRSFFQVFFLVFWWNFVPEVAVLTK